VVVATSVCYLVLSLHIWVTPTQPREYLLCVSTRLRWGQIIVLLGTCHFSL